jgi:VanZ family protein
MKLNYRTLHKARVLDRILFWPVLALVVWGQLGDLSALPEIEGSDKLAHFLAYFTLAAMAAAAFRERAPVWFAVFALMVLGASLEMVQAYVGREASVLDQLANMAGALTGGVVGRLIVEPLRRRYPGLA